MKTKDIFLSDNSIANDFIKAHEYPFEILPNIKNYTKAQLFVKGLLKTYLVYSSSSLLCYLILLNLVEQYNEIFVQILNIIDYVKLMR